MKRKTQALFARHTAIKSHAATQAVHQAQDQVTRLEQRIAQGDAQREQEQSQVREHLARGTSVATLSLDFASRLRHQHDAQQLQDRLGQELAVLKQAQLAQQQTRRQEKSAQKMGERLHQERLATSRRTQQLVQDELVCHVIELAS